MYKHQKLWEIGFGEFHKHKRFSTALKAWLVFCHHCLFYFFFYFNVDPQKFIFCVLPLFFVQCTHTVSTKYIFFISYRYTSFRNTFMSTIKKKKSNTNHFWKMLIKSFQIFSTQHNLLILYRKSHLLLDFLLDYILHLRHQLFLFFIV